MFHDSCPLVDKWIPTFIYISSNDYFKKFKCSKCYRDSLLYGKKYIYNVDKDINFDVYYWLHRKYTYNIYQWNDSIHNLCEYFKCERKNLLDYANQIGLSSLVELCTYHSLWLHHYYHEMYNNMEDWDSMTQPIHVQSKHQLSLLIILILSSEQRINLMDDVRHFSLCPPMKTNGIRGYEYRCLEKKFIKIL
jgi:hypothetical protein